MRNIKDVLFFREDISPFLVHLTKSNKSFSARDVLKEIINDMSLHSAGKPISDARFGIYTKNWSKDDKAKYFGAICFTETPIKEIHCLIDIADRFTNLESYGLVFIKEKLCNKGVSPVFYINNVNADKDNVFKAICSIIENYSNEATEILPLISVFGQKIQSPGARERSLGTNDWIWEREWRYPYNRGHLEFDDTDVFIGLCPDDNISYFERIFHPVEFIDPLRNMKYYSTKLIDARRRCRLKHSVV